ncbi:MAG: Fmu (Sun) domain-containing protein [Ferruginibacter sp.]
MSRYHSYINTAVQLLLSYKGEAPFAITLKNYFAQHKKYGSRDRREIATLCYQYFRIAVVVPQKVNAEILVAAQFLLSNIATPLLLDIKPEWKDSCALPLEEKIILSGLHFDTHALFPLKDHLSPAVDQSAFANALLQQPGLFVRIRPNYQKQVIQVLNNNTIANTLVAPDVLLLNQGTPVQTLFTPDKEVVIQDLNSSKVLNTFLTFFNTWKMQPNNSGKISVWDCCAASGGKSILLHDKIEASSLRLAVSDVRESILKNLSQRFKTAGIQNYRSFVADLAADSYRPTQDEYDIVICDAPCTGSGTWNRTPEQIPYATEAAIKKYAQIQRKIAVNAVRSLRFNGIFIYITCSVFKEENEATVDYLQAQGMLELVQQEILPGYNNQADSMFTALFVKKLNAVNK